MPWPRAGASPYVLNSPAPFLQALKALGYDLKGTARRAAVVPFSPNPVVPDAGAVADADAVFNESAVFTAAGTVCVPMEDAVFKSSFKSGAGKHILQGGLGDVHI